MSEHIIQKFEVPLLCRKRRLGWRLRNSKGRFLKAKRWRKAIFYGLLVNFKRMFEVRKLWWKNLEVIARRWNNPPWLISVWQCWLCSWGLLVEIRSCCWTKIGLVKKIHQQSFDEVLKYVFHWVQIWIGVKKHEKNDSNGVLNTYLMSKICFFCCT